jgi:hypothetical protein
MARYVFGLLGLLLVAALALVGLWRGPLADIPLGPPRGIAFEPDPADLHPPDLIVTDSEGQVALAPYSFCWEEGNQGVCAEGTAPESGTEPAFTSTEEQPVNLDFQMSWDLTISVDPEVGCDPFEITPGEMFSLDMDALGPSGDYVISIFARNDRGDASWMIRVHNEIEGPCGGDGI